MFHQFFHGGFCSAQWENMAGYILIVNKVAGTGHTVVPFILVPSICISNVLHSISQVCTLGTGWVHTDCVQAIPENVMRRYRLITFRI